MLREEVLKEWAKLKEDLVDAVQLIKIDNESALPTFPCGVEVCQRSLDYWTGSDEFLGKISQSENQFSPLLDKISEEKKLSSSLYFALKSKIDMFRQLTRGWKQERDRR